MTAGFPFILNFGSEYHIVSASIITVDDDGSADYTKVQDAINVANSGDTIYVWAGTYNENIKIFKRLILIGNSSKNTTINGGNINDVIYIAANYVNISGFTIIGSGTNVGDAGIELNNVQNCHITYNNCSTNYWGIRCESSGNNTIRNNNFHSNSDDGVFLIDSNNITIENNDFSLNIHNGIQFKDSNNNLIKNNKCHLAIGGGISLIGSKNNTIDTNLCKSNQGGGIGISYSSNNNKIKNNICFNGLDGILLWDTIGNMVLRNNCSNNDYGIYSYSSENNTISYNKIFNNIKYGLYSENSINNQIHHNNFIDNGKEGSQGYDNKPDNQWDDGYPSGGNYWNDYTGVDNKKGPNQDQVGSDGIGDTSYILNGSSNRDNYPLIEPIKWELPPNPPILLDPGDIDSDGNYNLFWKESYTALGYMLQEDSSITFDLITTIFNGSNLNFEIYHKNNGTYFYRLKAYNNFGESNWSNIVNITVDWLPDIPTNFKVSTYSPGNVLNLSWELNLNDTKEYCIEYKNDSNNNWTLIENFSHPIHIFDHTELQDGEKYYYRIQAKDFRDQLSSFSEIIFGIPWDSVPPAPPTGLRVVSTTNDSITLTWNPNFEDDLEGYHLFRSKIQNPNEWREPLGTIPKGTEDYIDTGLEEKTTYYYVLTAFDEVPNNSSFSNIAYGTTILGPYGPVINNSQNDFSIPEDTTDDSTIMLYNWFKDINNDTLEFSCEGQNNISVTIFQENGTVILIPKKDWNGKETLIFYANDSIFEISDDVTITVIPVNDPPGPAIIITPIENHTVQNGTAINFSAICYDLDIIYGDKLTFNWRSNLSNDIGIGDNLTNIILSPGNHTITLNVSDLIGETSRATVNITVLPEKSYNDIDPDKKKEDSSNSLIWMIIVILITIMIVIVIILFMILRKKKSQKVEEKKDDTKEETQ